MKQKHFHLNLSRWMRAFLILALVFLAVGLGTLGSVHGTGDSYRLARKRSADQKSPSIILHLTEPGHGDSGHEHRTLYITDIYINVGTVYKPYGTPATLNLAKGTSSEYFYQDFQVEIVNLYETVETEGKSETREGDMLFNWVKVDLDDRTWALSNSLYWEITAQGADILINEIVFVGNESDRSGTPVIIDATVDSASVLPDKDHLKRASAVIDSQHFPQLSQSSYFRYGKEEVAVLSTIAEMRLGSEYQTENTHHMDTVYNSFGLDLVALGTAIFGLSPFGLRFMPFLASFGILMFGFFLVRRMFKSERAGFAFALIYALCGLSMSLGHFGSPLTLGVCFILASFYFCYRFFEDGMEKAKFACAVPALLSGLFAALALCVNGAYIIPVLGIVGLFAAGVVRLCRKQRAALDLAIQEAEEEERILSQPVEGEQGDEPAQVSQPAQVSHPAKEKAVRLHNESNLKRSLSVCVFGVFLVFGFLLVSMLSALPLYNVFIKVYDDPASPQKSIFTFLWKAFAGGFTGGKDLVLSSAFNPLYALFHGSGEMFAVTSAGFLVACGAILMGIVGAVYAIIKLTRSKDSCELVQTVTLFAGFVLSLITAFFAKGALGFLFLSYLFLFALAALMERDVFEGEAKEKKGLKVLCRLLLAVLIVGFLLFAVFTFSIPLPASFMNSLLS